MAPRADRAVIAAAVALALGGSLLGACGGDEAPDSTGLSATDQSERPADRELTQRIRQALVDDDLLSTEAKNVEILTTAGGPVTLRGAVTTRTEKQYVVTTARQIAGGRPVVDELQVASQ